MERERVQQSTRERVGSAARSRSGKFAFSSSCPYSAKANFDIISSSRGSGKSLRSRRYRSLTAAQAATGFTRNCVLGFERNDQFQEMKRDTRLRKVLSRHFAYLFPYFISGAWSCLSRDMGRGTLFLYPQGANASAKVRNVEVRNNLDELGRTER